MAQETIRLDHTARNRRYQVNSCDCNRAISGFSVDLSSLAPVLVLYLAPEARSPYQTATLEKVHGSKERLHTTNPTRNGDLMMLESTLQSSDRFELETVTTSSLSQIYVFLYGHSLFYEHFLRHSEDVSIVPADIRNTFQDFFSKSQCEESDKSPARKP